ncbi:MAG: cupin domain-containing protein [Lachnospiraceae bacterium]|nr:cupin domain-containing protein [Lachnospiraceae bacterium]
MMKTKAEERKVENIDRPFGGAGFVSMEHLIGQEEMGSAGRLFASVTLKPFCEVGHHEHHGESETYYILSGEGMYEDNGVALPASSGDVFFCKDGDGHGIKNTGSKDLVFIALILSSK